MTDPQQMRIGTAERNAALALLGNHMKAGRLSPDDYTDRAGQVQRASTNGDLHLVFVDLPGGYGRPTGATGGSEAPLPPMNGAGISPDSGVGSGADDDSDHSGEAGRWIAIAGPLSLVLFFVCGFVFDGWAWAWLFFLLPGALGLWLYNGDHSAAGRARHDNRAEYRRQRRDRRSGPGTSG